MNCLDEGLIQAYLDDEVDANKANEIMSHLETCSNCYELYKSLKAADVFCTEALSSYAFQMERQYKKEKGVFYYMKKYQKYLASAAVVGLIVTGLSIEPVRAAVGEVVSVFRAEEIKTMDISLASLQELEQAISSKEGDINIDNLAQIKQSGGENEHLKSFEEAKSLADFDLKAIKGLTADYQMMGVDVTKKQTIDLTLKIEAVNDLMKTLGAEKLFDPSLDGKPFAIHVAPTVSANYSNSSNGNYLNYAQTRMPLVVAPTGTNLNDLMASIASMGILPASIQSQLKSMTDVNQTLYIPNIDGSIKTYDVGGLQVFGNFEEAGQGTYGYVTWMENDVLYSLSGNFDLGQLEAWLQGR